MTETPTGGSPDEEPKAPHEGEDEALHPKQVTLLRSSALMASGTLISRLLGFVRSALLVAAIGVTAGTAASFSVANALPNMIYNLLAAGVIDAILIPQIVSALKRGRAGNIYVNKLLTLAGTLLFGLTLLTLVASPLIITILASDLAPAERSLAVSFAWICIPQIFFYGIYNLLGELLIARGIFGPYMWAPVVNNVIGIATLSFYLKVWGPAGEVLPATEVSTTQMYFLGGTATLGVVLQALVLLIPLRKAQLKLRLNFKFRGTDFGSASQVAKWAFLTLLVSQLGVISTYQIITRADRFTTDTEVLVAGTQAYQYAFMVFMVPQSLVAVTLATAIFTRLANSVAENNLGEAADHYESGVRLISMLSSVAAAILLVASMPVMQLLMPTFGSESSALYGNVLVALALSLPFVGLVVMSQRAFFALENARPVFLSVVPPTIAQIIVGWSIYFTLEAQWWTIGAAGAETVGRIIQGIISLLWLGTVLPHISPKRILRNFGRSLFAMAVAALVGWGVMSVLSPISPEVSAAGRVTDALLKLIVVSLVILVVYFGILRFIDPEGFRSAVVAVTARIRPGRGPQATEKEEAGPASITEVALPELNVEAEVAGSFGTSLTDPNIVQEAVEASSEPESVQAEGASRALGLGAHDSQATWTGSIPQVPPPAQSAHSAGSASNVHSDGPNPARNQPEAEDAPGNETT